MRQHALGARIAGDPQYQVLEKRVRERPSCAMPSQSRRRLKVMRTASGCVHGLHRICVALIASALKLWG